MLHRRLEGAEETETLQVLYLDPQDCRRWLLPILQRLPVSELSSKAHISERTIRSIVAGRSVPRSQTTEKLALTIVKRVGIPYGSIPDLQADEVVAIFAKEG